MASLTGAHERAQLRRCNRSFFFYFFYVHLFSITCVCGHVFLGSSPCVHFLTCWKIDMRARITHTRTHAPTCAVVAGKEYSRWGSEIVLGLRHLYIKICRILHNHKYRTKWATFAPAAPKNLLFSPKMCFLFEFL